MLLLDFYVDEPSCLGVPPYISPYIRYAAGALVDGGIPQEKVSYLTVDRWRALGRELPLDPELVILIAGTTVPGKYLGGKIGTVQEVLEFLEFRQRYQKGSVTLLGGPIRHASAEIRHELEALGGVLIHGDVELYAHRLASHPAGIRTALQEILAGEPDVRKEERTYEQVDRWAARGAFITTLHPNSPYLMVELETYRGCTRETYCSFCTEALYGPPRFRSPEGIHQEVAELYTMGNRYFRLGRQADLLTYRPQKEGALQGFPRPSPENVEHLYAGIRRVAPDLKVLHLDNVNPGAVAAHPRLSSQVMEIITRYNTPGDTAAMGVESVDPGVIRLNRLKARREEVMRAIEIVNEKGARRVNGIPSLLPGINLLQGLPGETPDTFKKNYEFLAEVLERGLLLRRINIRRVVPYERTPLGRRERHEGEEGKTKRDGTKRRDRRRSDSAAEKRFQYYRDRIREKIDHVMLQRIFPPGTLLPEVILEAENPSYYLGRPLGSYPVTVKIPRTDSLASHPRVVDVMVTGAEERSLVGVVHPVRINELSRLALKSLPGLGKKRIQKILDARPIRDYETLVRIWESPPPGRESDYDFSLSEPSSFHGASGAHALNDRRES